jgi:ubiquinone/menaquinone biosynthesis C-methylase UbiE
MTPQKARISTTAVSAVRHPEWARQTRNERPPTSLDAYLQDWEDFFDHYASSVESWHRHNQGYHLAISSLAKFLVPENVSVLELGSGTGDLLAELKPSRGLGIDISGEMVRLAQKKHPGLEFRHESAEQLNLKGEKFDYIVLSDFIVFLFDIRLVFDRLRAACHPRTRIVIHWYSRLWQPILAFAEKLNLKYPQPLLNWTTVEDIENLLHLTNFELVHSRKHILLPKRVPILTSLANRYLAHLPAVRQLCLTNWIVARPVHLENTRRRPSVSVICPCRNEAGNIKQIAERLPMMGSETELIFVEGNSSDNTLAVCQQVAASTPSMKIRVLKQTGRGKGDAVRLGFSEAKGDILMILDADVSVAPEDLPYFYDALVFGKADFVNGCRLVYTMDPKAMRFLNLLGNRFFALLLSKLMGQHIKDSLCGTKVLTRSDYEVLARGRSYFGQIDPFGDFDLLFGAAKLNLKIVEIPIRYRQRVYGSTNISRFADGWLLLRMSAKAAVKLFFIS